MIKNGWTKLYDEHNCIHSNQNKNHKNHRNPYNLAPSLIRLQEIDRTYNWIIGAGYIAIGMILGIMVCGIMIN